MSGIRKHGSHRYGLNTSTAAAGTAATPAAWIYDAYAGPQTVIGGGGGIDPTTEQITEMALALTSALTGQATSFTTFRVTHRNSGGSTVDQLTIAASAAGAVFSAFVAADLAVASGATVPGAGTAVLGVPSGNPLPWTLANGDTVAVDTTVGGGGQYTGGIALGFTVQAKGS